MDDLVQPTGLVVEPSVDAGATPGDAGNGATDKRRKIKVEAVVRIRQLIHMSGTHADYPKDLERDTTAKEAEAMCKAGFAELVEGDDDDTDGEGDDKPAPKRGRKGKGK